MKEGNLLIGEGLGGLKKWKVSEWVSVESELVSIEITDRFFLENTDFQ